jgi:hypothetical protein
MRKILGILVAMAIACVAFLKFNVVLRYDNTRAGWHCVQSFGQGGYDRITIDRKTRAEIYTWVEESNLMNCSIDHAVR